MNVSNSAPGGRPPISAAVICFNQQHNIGRCLSALTWCEQIVVVDSGSTDATCDIVRRYPRVKLLHRPFDNFINQKNFALDACDHRWVLSVDADEVLTAELCREIAGLKFDAAGYFIGRRTFLGKREIKHGTWSPDYNLRLLRKDRGRWGGSNPHEHVVLSGVARRLRHRMLHYSYRSRQEFLARNEKYTRMIVEHVGRQSGAGYPLRPWVHAIGNFVKAYVLKQGFRDGAEGWFIAWHMARFSRLKYSLLAQRGRSAGPRALGAPQAAAAEANLPPADRKLVA